MILGAFDGRGPPLGGPGHECRPIRGQVAALGGGRVEDRHRVPGRVEGAAGLALACEELVVPAPDLAARGAGVARRLDGLGEIGLGGRDDRQLIVERLGFGRPGEAHFDVGEVVTKSPQLLVHPRLLGDRLLDGRRRLLQRPVHRGQAPFRTMEVRRAAALRQGVDRLPTHEAGGSHGQRGRQRLGVRFDAQPVELGGVRLPVATGPLLGGA